MTPIADFSEQLNAEMNAFIVPEQRPKHQL